MLRCFVLLTAFHSNVFLFPLIISCEWVVIFYFTIERSRIQRPTPVETVKKKLGTQKTTSFLLASFSLKASSNVRQCELLGLSTWWDANPNSDSITNQIHHYLHHCLQNMEISNPKPHLHFHPSPPLQQQKSLPPLQALRRWRRHQRKILFA